VLHRAWTLLFGIKGGCFSEVSMAVTCGIDFSEHSVDVARVAAHFAVRKKVAVELLHAAPAEVAAEMTARVADAAKQLCSTGAHVRERVVSGGPVEGLVDWAVTHRSELLVLGAGSSASLGDTAELAARYAPIPTLVVRDAGPLDEWFRGERPLQVVVASDVNDAAVRAIDWASSLRELGFVELTVLHIYSPVEAPRKLGLTTGANAFERNEQVELALEKALARRVWGPAAPGNVKIEVRPGAGPVGERVAAYAQELGADLLVLGNHRRRGRERASHGSVSQSALRASSLNVAVVPGHHAASARRPRRFLVAVDFTPASERAVQQAFAMAGYGCSVLLVNVQRRPLSESERAAVRDLLVRLVPFDAARSGLTVQVLVLESADPAEAIVLAAERLDADVILMGTRALGGVRRVLEGSVSQAVVGITSRPVLLQRDVDT
jgi:nucleotide-binding universal stress UspA family protein